VAIYVDVLSVTKEIVVENSCVLWKCMGRICSAIMRDNFRGFLNSFIYLSTELVHGLSKKKPNLLIKTFIDKFAT
jgi:hypothetical protein